MSKKFANRRIYEKCILLYFSIFLFSCSGSSESRITLYIDSSPSYAVIFYESEYIGIAPVELTFTDVKEINVEYSLQNIRAVWLSGAEKSAPPIFIGKNRDYRDIMIERPQDAPGEEIDLQFENQVEERIRDLGKAFKGLDDSARRAELAKIKENLDYINSRRE